MDTTKIAENARAILAEVNDVRPEPGLLERTEPAPAEYAIAQPVGDGNYLVVGIGQAEPGGIAEIEVLGQTVVPVQGFGMRVGCSPSVRLIRGTVTPELQGITGLSDPENIAQQSKGQGVEAYLSLMVLFMRQITGKVDIKTGNPVDDALEDLRNNPPQAPTDATFRELTPLVTLKLQLPEDARPGTRFALMNESWKFGRVMRYPNGRRTVLRTSNEFGTSKEVAAHGIQPTLVSGWIDVV